MIVKNITEKFHRAWWQIRRSPGDGEAAVSEQAMLDSINLQRTLDSQKLQVDEKPVGG